MSHVLILTGPGGAGKTTIAKLLAKQRGCAYMDGDQEDSAFFPHGGQWLPEHTDLLKKAHERIFQVVQGLTTQGKDVILDYIIFGRYLEFLRRFQLAYGESVQVFILFPSAAECIHRDAARPSWTTGAERITAVRAELNALRDDIGSAHFLDTTGQTPEQTIARYFSS